MFNSEYGALITAPNGNVDGKNTDSPVSTKIKPVICEKLFIKEGPPEVNSCFKTI